MSVQLNTSQSPHRSQRPSNPAVSAFITLLLMAIVYGFVTGWFKGDSSAITLTEFESVQIGMTLAEVEAIAGEKGKVTFEGAGGITYAFDGKGIGANGSFTFSEGRLTNKAQLGLK